MCSRSHWLRWHDGKDYTDTDKTTHTLSENFEGFSQILLEQSGKKVTFIFTPKSNNLKIWKSPHLKKKLLVCVLVDYADTQFSNFAIEYLRENEKVHKTVFACSYGTQIEYFKQQKYCQKPRDTVPFKACNLRLQSKQLRETRDDIFSFKFHRPMVLDSKPAWRRNFLVRLNPKVS